MLFSSFYGWESNEQLLQSVTKPFLRTSVSDWVGGWEAPSPNMSKETEIFESLFLIQWMRTPEPRYEHTQVPTLWPKTSYLAHRASLRVSGYLFTCLDTDTGRVIEKEMIEKDKESWKHRTWVSVTCAKQRGQALIIQLHRALLGLWQLRDTWNPEGLSVSSWSP